VTFESTVKADASSKLALDRTRLAYDRTMLAWIRTATSLISFGFGIKQFFRIAQPNALQSSSSLIHPNQFGFLMIVIGLLALLLATFEHRSALQTLRLEYPAISQYPTIPRSPAAILGALIGILGLLALFDAVLGL
jgi:putative membrane protein